MGLEGTESFEATAIYLGKLNNVSPKLETLLQFRIFALMTHSKNENDISFHSWYKKKNHAAKPQKKRTTIAGCRKNGIEMDLM